MTGLAAAVERSQWQIVSLYLLLGVSDVAAQLPPETLASLLDLLGGDEAFDSEVVAHGG